MRKALGGLRSAGEKVRAWLCGGWAGPSPKVSQSSGPLEKPQGEPSASPKEKSSEKTKGKPSEKPGKKSPPRTEGLWRKSWRAFLEGLVYLLPWLLIPLVVGLIVALPQIVEPLFGPSRGAVLLLFIRLSQIGLQPALLAGLLAALVGFGVEAWKRQKEEERRQKEHILGEVETVGQRLREGRWGEALRYYTDFRHRRALAWGDREVQERLRDIWEREAPELLRDYAECLEQCPRPDAPPSGWWEEKVGGVEKAVEALFWAGQNMSREDYDRATEMMTSLLSHPEVAVMAGQALLQLLPHQKEAVKRWLWDRRFEKPLESDEEWAKPLRELRAEPRTRPPLWRSPRPADRDGVQQVLQKWRLKKNPFGPEAAEMEADLPKIGYEPPAWEALKRLEPTLIVGPAGSGKSAAALLRAHGWLKEIADPFPVYASLSLPNPANTETMLSNLSRLLAGALVEYLALDPDAFLAAERPERAGMAGLLLSLFGPKERLAARFAQAGLSCSEGVGNALLEEMAALAEPLGPGNWDLFPLLGRARPAHREVTVFLLEPQVEGKPRDFAGRLQPLLDLALPLSRQGVYLKIFLPDTVRPMGWEGNTFHLRWSEDDLLAMLQTRLLTSGLRGGTLNEKASHDTLARVSDVDRWLVERVQGSPRELVRLGNRLLEIVAKHPEEPRIFPADLEQLDSGREA